MRLALPRLGTDGTAALTNKIFGGLGCPAELVLCSYKTETKLQPQAIRDAQKDGYVNFPSREAHETWGIPVECNEPFGDLIGDLLNLAQQLGGLGAGWRSPPHRLTRFNGFRGSQFTLHIKSKAVDPVPLADLLSRLEQQILGLAQRYGIPVLRGGAGRVYGIWESENRRAWEGIVHGVCSTSASPRPAWCGDSEHRPSGYSVRELEDRCRVTVLDPDVVPTLQVMEFRQVWTA